MDVIARSKSGPATGLTRDDFTLLDNGKPQKISFFSVRSTRTSGLVPSGRAAVPLPEGALSNRLERDGEANATVLLIDQKNTPQTDQAFAIQRIVKFLEMRRRGDRIGVYIFARDGSLRTVQEITDDAELLRRAANSLKPRDPIYRTNDTTGMTAHAAEGYQGLTLTERAMDFKRVLEMIARHVASVPGRKSLIWTTTGFPLLVPELGLDFRPDMEEAARALNDSSVALYAVDARGLTGALNGMTAIASAEFRGPQSPALLRQQMGRGGGDPSGLDTMYMLAGLTGGLVLRNDNGIEDLIRTAMDDGELTYTLGFYPTEEKDEKQDGVSHNLKVEVRRRGVSVRYRANYLASGTLAAGNDRPTLDELLKAPLDAAQVGLAAETAPDSARPGSWQVRVSIDLHDVHLEHENNSFVGAVDVTFFIEGSGSARTLTRNIVIPEGQMAAALEQGLAVTASSGAGLLRIVAQDRATGAAGSVKVLLGQR